ncbi:type IX secretion system membrane protein PorP/SprF [Spongiimicrobium sp. 3-5]|uniref:PorP/SprF family type IX secretion system membrane protein n=1 Tax=Spongiimicrobium sp. 3-5 TaxID=3332596 RepID=UPI00397EF078
MFIVGQAAVHAQEDTPFIAYDVPAQNLLKFNRFLINPTFSTVRENNSYVNLFHRNQSVSFDDNNQTYFLSYSGRINDRTGLGLSLYTQREGLITNFGVLANYAYGIKLSDKSNFTFGANISYYNSGFDESRANPVEDDPLLNGFQDSNLLSFQPGFNLSYGNFDFGVFAENLFDYNLKTSESVTEFNEKTFSSHLQYTHRFENASGILEEGRIMPLARVRKVGENDIVLGGNLIFDLPKLGWVQAGYDDFYGASAGIGFNLNRRLSLGYTMEKGLSNNFDNFGVTHEISFAYSFTPNLTEDRVMLEEDADDLVENQDQEEDATLASKDEEIEKLKQRLEENDAILAELMFRQDSMETNRQNDLERRFEMVMRMVRNETNGGRPDLEEKAKQMYFLNNDKSADNTELALEDTNSPSNKQAVEATLSDNYDTATAENTIIKNPIEPIGIKNTDKVKQIVTANRKETRTYPTSKRDVTAIDDFAQEAKRNNVKGRKFRNLDGVTDGYYVVANVYKGEHYLNKFMNGLEAKGLNPNYIDNTKNGLKYVYLERYDTWKEALAAHKSKVNGTYDGEVWIMNVENRYTNEAYVDNVNKIKEKSSKYDANVLQKNVVVKDKVAANTPTAKNYNIDGQASGYYIIANVFASARNANRFVKLLNSQGLSASYFINPKNNWRYVYLKKHGSWNNALISYYTKLNDAYDDEMWIMRVTPNLLT